MNRDNIPQSDEDYLKEKPSYQQLLEQRDNYKECYEDKQRLIREIDVLINGENGAAQQASLCDLISQIKRLVEQRDELLEALEIPSSRKSSAQQ